MSWINEKCYGSESLSRFIVWRIVGPIGIECRKNTPEVESMGEVIRFKRIEVVNISHVLKLE